MNDRIYHGRYDERGNLIVGVDGEALESRCDLFNHSPLGFECGYGGSGPAQLALAILADHFLHRVTDMPIAEKAAGLGPLLDDLPAVADHLAVRLHQAFKFGVIATLKRGAPWAITSSDVTDWLQRRAAIVAEKACVGAAEEGT